MKDFFQDVVRIVRDIMREGERKVAHSFYGIKRQLFRFALEFMIFAIAIVFVLVGAVMVIDNYLPIEWVLLITGLLMINFVLLTAKFR